MSARSKKSRRRRRIIAALVLAFAPVPLILPLWLLNPPVTAMMAARAIERLRAGTQPAFPRHQVVSLSRISPVLVRAVLAAEDDAFYQHFGFDVRQIENAIKEHRGKRRGASTITQQTAKNLFLWSGRSFLRKGLEAYLTVWLELLLSKDRILTVYLNLVECGDGYFGVEACSVHHFKKHASELTTDEAARLAAILPSPRRWSPFGDYASERLPELLARMAVPIQR
ncbi:MAG: monofunctional biosynthetic peptidoglycan transglycosylase [Deltaproteobacteria bacterium]|nr:monofunctional biosynthetic peptidoglycan transglycosylase [Deltaproteobacteria bacterium]